MFAHDIRVLPSGLVPQGAKIIKSSLVVEIMIIYEFSRHVGHPFGRLPIYLLLGCNAFAFVLSRIGVHSGLRSSLIRLCVDRLGRGESSATFDLRGECLLFQVLSSLWNWSVLLTSHSVREGTYRAVDLTGCICNHTGRGCIR